MTVSERRSRRRVSFAAGSSVSGSSVSGRRSSEGAGGIRDPSGQTRSHSRLTVTATPEAQPCHLTSGPCARSRPSGRGTDLVGLLAGEPDDAGLDAPGVIGAERGQRLPATATPLPALDTPTAPFTGESNRADRDLTEATAAACTQLPYATGGPAMTTPTPAPCPPAAPISSESREVSGEEEIAFAAGRIAGRDAAGTTNTEGDHSFRAAGIPATPSPTPAPDPLAVTRSTTEPMSAAVEQPGAEAETHPPGPPRLPTPAEPPASPPTPQWTGDPRGGPPGPRARSRQRPRRVVVDRRRPTARSSSAFSARRQYRTNMELYVQRDGASWPRTVAA